MTDRVALLHNMSAPPKSVMKYSGLSDLATDSGPSGTGITSLKFTNKGVFGKPIRFVLPEDFEDKSPADILRHLEVDPTHDPKRKLVSLINARANELPLPGACMVIPVHKSHAQIWTDALSALAILSKCSDHIWLCSKEPSLKAALIRRHVSLLIPPLFVDRLPRKPR